MEKNSKRRFLNKFLLLAVILAFSGIFGVGQTKVQAATTGFVTRNGITYYYENGKKHTGWLKLSGKYYYFGSTGQMATGWRKSSKGYRYFHKKKGYMYTGWIKCDTKRRYFNPADGIMKTGMTNIGGKYYYFNAKDGLTYIGWAKNSKGQMRYFNPSDGHMVTGWVGSGAKRRYFNPKNGYLTKGWYKTTNYSYYFNDSTGYLALGKTKIGTKFYIFHPTTGKMVTGWYTAPDGKKYFLSKKTGEMATKNITVNGVIYKFDSSGVFLGTETTDVSIKPDGSKTLKNLFLAGIQPIGSTLYKWAGGHDADATRVGLNPEWAQAYATGSYSAGLDCSGYIGWTVYQVMRKFSTGISDDMADLYVSYGWGQKAALSRVSKLLPGDIIGTPQHVWMVLGTCSDGSVVIMHSAGTDWGGPQFSGTGGEAYQLAKTYMSKYSGSKKYTYSNGYIDFMSKSSYEYNNGVVFRFSSSVLADPDGFRSMTAAQILSKLSGAIGLK